MKPTYSPFEPLSVEAIVHIARHNVALTPISSGDPAATRLERSAAWVASAMQAVEQGGAPTAYYAINTGFGDNAGRAVFRRVEDAERLSRNLLLSHTIGVGDHLPEDIVRAALAIRVASLAHGYSGVRIEVINTLIAMLNQHVYPAVPAKGSLGASGDLAPLAHLVLPLSAPLPDEDASVPGATRYGYVEGHLVSGAEAMRAAGIPQIRLGAKEGVALINGTAISLAIATLAYHDAQQVYAASQAGTALAAEALRGFRDAFLPYAHRLRSKHQAAAAAVLLRTVEGSTLIRGGADVDLSAAEGPPQDPYSLRCAPVVFGAAGAALEHIGAVISEELRAVTDNPLIFADDDSTSPDFLPRATKMISGGNFHGAPIGYIMDYLATVMTDLGSIAERRVFTLTDPRLSRGLPPFLIAEPPEHAGLNSGLMIAQYTAASLVSENKALAHPASVDSIPSSANREDHVSMSTIAARKAAQIVANVRKIIAIELLCAVQGLWLRLEQSPDARIGTGTARILETVSGLWLGPGVPFSVIRRDVPLTPYVAALEDAIRAGQITP